MITYIIILFVVGYLCIALEHPLKINKTATALVLGMLLWVIYALGASDIVPDIAGEKFQQYVSDNPALYQQSEHKQALSYVCDVDLIGHMGDIAQTILFLLGAMTIVELIDVHDGFTVRTSHIHTRNRRKLLWIMTWLTFFLSAVLDNLTTTIVMLTLLRKFVPHKRERWLYAGIIVLAANSGGAWSPIGDVTTILLWANGNVTAPSLVKFLLLPSIISVLIPALVISRKLKGRLPDPIKNDIQRSDMSKGDKLFIFCLGVGGLIFVPIFKTITHLPPFIGILLVLGILWVVTECLYNGHLRKQKQQFRIPQVISRVDMPSILFFLGILMAVAVLQSTGILSTMANALDTYIHNIYAINTLLGVLSSIVDNVPMVAGVMGMYPIADPSVSGYAANFVVDGHFWGLLSYCAGVGGSLLIIGSAAGVIAMGIEKISFGWYLKKFTGLALLGYLAGIVIYMAEHYLFG